MTAVPPRVRFTTVSAARAALMVAVTVTSVAPAFSAMVPGLAERVMVSGSPMVSTASLKVAWDAVAVQIIVSFGSSRSSAQIW